NYSASVSGQITRLVSLTRMKEKLEPKPQYIEQILGQLQTGQIWLERWAGRDDGWIVMAPIKAAAGKNRLMAVSYFRNSTFLETLNSAKLLNNYLVSSDSKIIMRPEVSAHSISPLALDQALSVLSNRDTTNLGVFESAPRTPSSLLVSYASVGAGGLKVIAAIPMSAAMQTANQIVRKSYYFWVFLICLSIATGVLGAAGLTNNLGRLHRAVAHFGSGDLDVKIDIRGRDEVADLGQGFNKMTQQIRNLIHATAEKARMEHELKTAQLLQETIFPSMHLEAGQMELMGFYRPASECSGDWWMHSLSGDQLTLVIADATGHGAPAALLTSAARSAYSVLARTPNLSPQMWLRGLNRAIFDTAKGTMQMTATLVNLDIHTGLLKYSIASHEPTGLIRHADKPVTRRSIHALQVERGSRLGESGDSDYPEAEVQLHPGDLLFFYTDGLTELINSKEEMLGERGVYQLLADLFNRDLSLREMVQELEELISRHQGHAAQMDDISFVLVKFGKGPTST
ncbi:MAG: PP2C family protein-serine/threonine phosphatase, partial [Bdellovibrionales bacterium]